MCAPACTYGGKRYGAGEKYLTSDGCNDCTCNESGNSTCTQFECKMLYSQ